MRPISMKHHQFFVTVGGFLGFSLAFFSGLQAGNDIAIVLRDGSIGCLVGAVFARGLLHVIVESLRSVAAERRRAREAEQQQASLEEAEAPSTD